MSSGQPEAWILIGNFRFPIGAATHEGQPTVPPHRILIWLGDFILDGPALHWQRVQHLRLPNRRTGRVVLWHVRFAGRALWLGVRYGSPPSERSRALVNAILESVEPVNG